MPRRKEREKEGGRERKREREGSREREREGGEVIKSSLSKYVKRSTHGACTVRRHIGNGCTSLVLRYSYDDYFKITVPF